MAPLIIEAAINGPAAYPANPHLARSPAAIAADAIACFQAGASIVHNHVDQRLSGDACAGLYLEAYRPILSAVPDAILCCGLGGAVEADDIVQCYAHVAPLAEAGMAMAIADPGSLTFNVRDAPDGTPGAENIVYVNGYRDVAYFMGLLAECGLGPSISIFEPSFLRATIAYHRAGKLPPGALVKLYFGGDHSPFTRQPSATTFGLPPTQKAFDAYLEMLEGIDLPWGVAVIGGDLAGTVVAELAIRHGGHVRVGLEDYAGQRTPRNIELIAEMVDLAHRCGREIADCATAREILGLPRIAAPY